MHDKKKHLQELKSEFHAIAPLPIEEVARRLAKLKDPQTSVVLDVYKDQIVTFELHRKQVVAKGRLMRWQGTETRIDANTFSESLGEWLGFAYDGLLFVGYCVLYSVIIFIFSSVLLPYTTSQTLPFSIVISIVITALFFRGSSFGGHSRLKTLQDMDLLLQHLAIIITENTFAPLFEFDGTEDALERLLHARAKSVPIGADGEFNI